MTSKNIIFKISPVGNDINTCYLQQNNWDDFGFKTTFEISFVDGLGQQRNLGRISVTSKGLKGGYVEITDNFKQLSNDFCSLGQGQGYYEELMALSEDDREAILIGLRDCVYNQEIFNEFKSEESVQRSLLRGVSEKNVTSLFPEILKGNLILKSYHFSFEIDNCDTKMEIKVTPESNPPTNIHVLIGRNGVGKTRILSGIADNLSENWTPPEISMKGKLTFNDEPDLFFESTERFSNLVTVAFSAFDKFSPINKKNVKIPCEYIGLKNESGKEYRTPESLGSDFIISVKKCLESERKNRWIDAIKILNSDPIFNEYRLDCIMQNLNKEKELISIFDNLSSGHKIILLTITKLVEFVDDKTLVLMDEPECHLHPPLLSSFIRCISDLLIKRNAVAIIATHSPVVLQEVPKSCVTKIDRVGDAVALSRPGIETYAENIGALTRDIFQLELMNSGFYKTIADAIEKNPNYDNLIKDFGSEIGAEGRAIARSIVATRRDKDA